MWEGGRVGKGKERKGRKEVRKAGRKGSGRGKMERKKDRDVTDSEWSSQTEM